MGRIRQGWVAVGLGVLLGLTACQSPPAGNPRSVSVDSAQALPEAQFQVQAPVLKQTDAQGRLLWRLEAQVLKGEAQSGDAQGTLRSVRGWLYRAGKPVLEFSAPFARADSKRQEVVAWGGVVAHSKVNRAELRAGRIAWRARADRIVASDGVRLRWDTFELQERAVVVDTALEKAWGAP